MLEKLGSILKKTSDRIANAIFLDRNIVDSIVKDLQRALIEADVNIKLVKDLSDKLKKIAYDERISGIEKKEHLIKSLHDELKGILGENKKLELLENKQNRILLLGLYGAGKCVHGKSNIQLSNGEIIKADNLYSKYKKIHEPEKLEDGEIINISDQNLFVPSFNPKTLKIEDKKATHLWKLKKENLMEIKLDNGNDYLIKVTPEHPFFVLINGQVTKIRADEITENDFISVPNKIEIKGKTINLFNQIKNLDFYVYSTPQEAKELIFKKYPSIKEACKNLRYKKNYCQLTLDIKKGKIPIELIEKQDFNFLRIKGFNDEKIITIPLFLNKEFSEFVGYVVGDGHIGKNYIELSNEDPEIISRFMELSKELFNIIPSIKKDKRRRKLYQIRLCSNTLVKIMSIFGLKPGRKGKNLQVPEQIILSKEDIIKYFIKAYFDCDSHPSKNKRYIELTSESQSIIKQTDFLLRRFGIISAISKKTINNISYWKLSIKAKYAEIFSEKISYLVRHKKDNIKKYKQIGEIQGSGNQDMIPLGNSLKALRLMLGFSIGEIQENAVYSYGIYEQKGFISREKLIKLIQYYKIKQQGFFLNFLENIKGES